jgi:hypothetical protein
VPGPDPARRRLPRRVDPLEAVAAAAIAEAERAAISEDIAAGLVPPWVRRSLHPHELTAGVVFAAIDADEERFARAIARRLADERAAALELVGSYLRTFPTGVQATEALSRLEVDGLAGVPRMAALVEVTRRDLRVVLEQAHAAGAGRVLAEAAQQGVLGVPGSALVTAPTAAQLDQLALRLAVAPQVALVQALREEAVRMPTPADVGALVDHLAEHAAGLSDRALADVARQSSSGADGLGRQDGAVAVPVPPARVYASELLDGATCGPCSFVDGNEYPDIPAGRLDYPNGLYRLCEGGLRCRGTLVFVWPSEAPATVAR